MALKIFLTADVHLGMKFASYPEAQSELSEARFNTLAKCISIANKEECDLFVVAGDLFDRVSISDKDIIRAAKTLSEFQGRFSCTLPGNHDYYPSGSRDIWELFKQHTGDSHAILKEETCFSLKQFDLDVNLYPAPCDAKHSENNKMSWIKKFEINSNVKYHIGIAHGSLEGFSPDFDKKYYPMKVKELIECGLDLWLLGHTHLQYPDPENPTMDGKIFYPGTPEPDGFDCKHDGKALIIRIDDDKKIHTTSPSTGTYRFLHDEINLNSASDLDKLKTRYSSQRFKKTLLKLFLKGNLHKDSYNELLSIMDTIEKSFFYLYRPVDMSELKESITPKDIDAEFSEGSFPYLLLTELSNEEDSLALQIAYNLIQEVRK
ncbi:MAG: DNA repair exonuclease [Spirochaetota bacterium]|nr:MAG: DNA repair exonuclease [Spirochaetota bacterium]